jgi:hypothetical protein
LKDIGNKKTNLVIAFNDYDYEDDYDDDNKEQKIYHTNIINSETNNFKILNKNIEELINIFNITNPLQTLNTLNSSE